MSRKISTRPGYISNYAMDSLVLRYDQLTKNSRVLRQGMEEKFLEFVINQGLCRESWGQAETELSRINLELKECKVEVTKLEVKLSQARDLLAAETGLRKKAEQEREEARLELRIVKDLLSQTVSNSCGQNGETSARQHNLGIPLSNRPGLALQSPMRGYHPSPIRRLAGANSTCSILDASDLSFDTSQNIQGPTTAPSRSDPVKSSDVVTAVAAVNNVQIINKSPVLALEAARRIAGEDEEIGDGNTKECSIAEEYVKTNTEEQLDSTVVSWQFTRGHTLPSSHSTKKTPSHYRTTSQDPQTEASCTNSIQSFNSIPKIQAVETPHQFVQKNNFRTEICGPCRNKIKFGKIYYKCRECRIVSHPECRVGVASSCVSTVTQTPSRSRSFKTHQEANYQDSAKKKGNENMEFDEDKERNTIFPSPLIY